MQLVNDISEIEKDKKYAMFIRHADRDKIHPGTFGNEVELNEQGKLNSQELGKKLSHLKVHHMYASPIMRCIQTATFINENLSEKANIEPAKHLGDPGIYVEDNELAGKTFLKTPFEELYTCLFAGGKPTGFRTMAEGSDLMKDFIKTKTTKPGLTVFVTHDMLVALFMHHTFGKKFNRENWPKYLEGAIILIE